MTDADNVLVERDGPVTIVTINRPHCRNAVDGATARKLFDAFCAFDADAEASVGRDSSQFGKVLRKVNRTPSAGRSPRRFRR